MLARPLLSLAASAVVAWAAVYDGAATPPLAPTLDAEALAAQLQCVACHDAPAETVARLQSLGAPALTGIGGRVTPAWLRVWLRGGHTARTGSRMPDLLHGFAPAQREDAIEDLTHLLASLGGPFAARAASADAWRADEGARLYQQLACAACHAEDSIAARALATKTDLPTLADFLRAPHLTRPGGGMPDFGLTRAEAEALAAHLLRAQLASGPAREELTPGVRYAYSEYPLEGPLPPDLDAIPDSAPVLEGIAEHVGLLDGRRPERFAYRFEGWLELELEERIGFGLNSDDGSRLLVNGELLVDNDGHHAPQTVEAEVLLAAGVHRIVVEMFEAEGGETLEAWIVRAGHRAPLGAEQLTVRVPVYEPLGFAPEAPDPHRIARGHARFDALGCGSCHGGVAPPPAPRPELNWEVLQPDRGCLADPPSAASADYGLDEAARAALRGLVARGAELRKPAPPTEAVQHALQRLQCTACHVRAGAGRPTPAITAAFSGDGDLGEEGRIPPTLDGVGTKLRREALEAVLDGRGSVRPYLHARMPRFAREQTLGLAEAFDAADWRSGEDQPPAFDAELVELGRRLGGAGGLNCVQCHPAAGHAASGMQTIDLTELAGRLDAAWFRAWMENPLAMRKGTRMPVFFAGGRSIQREILGGDARRQIDALWAWLSLGPSLPLPDGLIVEEGAYALVPTSRPLYFGAFMEGGSPRVLNVGFPERVHLSFDFEQVRLMQVWRGDFFDAEGTWHGRAGALERPAGTALRALPAGPPFARLEGDRPWPVLGGKANGWRALGHRRDALERPTFRYAFGELQVEESVSPEYAEGGAVLLRRFKVEAPAGQRWALRAMLASAWTRAADGAWHSDDGWRIVVAGAVATPRAAIATTELLVGVPDGGGEFELRMSW